jgi:hypothetical protein
MVDTGADFSMAPREVVELLGFDIDSAPGPLYPCSGVASGGHAKRFDIHVGIFAEGGPLELDLPFMVVVDRKPGQTKEVLLGRHPLFHDFDFTFRMGYTDDPEIGKFTVRGVKKRHKAGRYKHYPQVLAPSSSPRKQ